MVLTFTFMEQEILEIWFELRFGIPDYSVSRVCVCEAPWQIENEKLTKHIEQVKSISSLAKSKIPQVSDGFPSLNIRSIPSDDDAVALSDLNLLSLILMQRAISS
jgi:hypothetical protein